MDDEQLLRYSRQIMLPEVDAAGQQRLTESRALVVGLGGLGSPAAMYLAAAGVGHLALSDPDKVDLSNLQRQIIHGTRAIGCPKTESAIHTLQSLNPMVKVEGLARVLEAAELEAQVAAADVALDCSDNFAARFALNRACIRQRTPWLSAAAIRMEGQVIAFDPRRDDSPCYRCLYPDDTELAERCSDTGILGSVVGIFGAIQATEAVKILLDIGRPLVGKLLTLDARTMEWLAIQVPRQKNCPHCGGKTKTKSKTKSKEENP